jgi:hypothetical protein
MDIMEKEIMNIIWKEHKSIKGKKNTIPLIKLAEIKWSNF